MQFYIESMPVTGKILARKSGRRLSETSSFLDSPLQERDSHQGRYLFFFFFFFSSLFHRLRAFASFSSLYINAYGSLGVKTVGVSVRKAARILFRMRRSVAAQQSRGVL